MPSSTCCHYVVNFPAIYVSGSCFIKCIRLFRKPMLIRMYHLIRELKLEQDLNRNRLVQVRFTLQITSVSSPRSIDLALSQVEIANGTPHYDVALVMTDTAQ